MVFSARGCRTATHGPAIHDWVLDPEVPGLVRRMDLVDTWWGMAMGVDAETGDADPIRLVRALIGPGPTTSRWRSCPRTVDRADARRECLRHRPGVPLGDVAHLGSMGRPRVQDCGGRCGEHRPELAAVLQGWGGEALLRSYQHERKSLALQVIDPAMLKMSQPSTNFAEPRSTPTRT